MVVECLLLSATDFANYSYSCNKIIFKILQHFYLYVFAKYLYLQNLLFSIFKKLLNHRIPCICHTVTLMPTCFYLALFVSWLSQQALRNSKYWYPAANLIAIKHLNFDHFISLPSLHINFTFHVYYHVAYKLQSLNGTLFFSNTYIFSLHKKTTFTIFYFDQLRDIPFSVISNKYFHLYLKI